MCEFFFPLRNCVNRQLTVILLLVCPVSPHDDTEVKQLHGLPLSGCLHGRNREPEGHHRPGGVDFFFFWLLLSCQGFLSNPRTKCVAGKPPGPNMAAYSFKSSCSPSAFGGFQPNTAAHFTPCLCKNPRDSSRCSSQSERAETQLRRKLDCREAWPLPHCRPHSGLLLIAVCQHLISSARRTETSPSERHVHPLEFGMVFPATLTVPHHRASA